VTAQAASRAPAGEAGFRLLAEHLPDLVVLAFDPDLRIWAATGAAIRARGWVPGDFVGRKVPEVGRPADAGITEAYCLAALEGGAAGSRRPGTSSRPGRGRSCSCPCPRNAGPWSAA
jgi:PAS fold